MTTLFRFVPLRFAVLPRPPASLVAALVAAWQLLAARPAWAQRYLIGARAELASGAEGGGAMKGFQVERAPTTLRLGADVRVDEFPADVFRAAVLVGFEPRASLGLDAEYGRRLGERLLAHAGALAIVAPSSLFGAQAGVTVSGKGDKHPTWTLGPTVRVFPLGADLPDGTIVWQGLFFAGVRGDL